jgi:enoyl-CoA hydratase/carnithine racemase
MNQALPRTPNAGVGPILLTSRDNGVVTLCLNRPDKFNTLSEAMLGALQDALDEIAADQNARCVVISGAGKAFCAGHDLREMRGQPDFGYYQTLFAQCSRVMESIVSLPVPVIAKVHGIATAAGCQLVASCDLAIASKSARFAVSGVNLGLFCSTPAVALSRNVAAKHAFDMLVTGEFIDADRALEIGLINQAVEDSDLDAAVDAKVTAILSRDPKAIRLGKAAFYRQRRLSLTEAYSLTSEVMACNMMELDTQEAIDAFLEKRPAKLSFRT